MYKNFIFDAMKEFAKNERKKPMHIYLDENGETKEEPLTQDSAGSYKINRNPLKLIYDSLF